MKLIMENWRKFLVEVKWKPIGNVGAESSPAKEALRKLLPDLDKFGTNIANQIMEVLLNPDKKPMFYSGSKEVRETLVALSKNENFQKILAKNGLTYELGDVALIGKIENVTDATTLFKNRKYRLENYRHMDDDFLKKYLKSSAGTPEFHQKLGELLGYGKEEAETYAKIERQTMQNLYDDGLDPLNRDHRQKSYAKAHAQLDVERTDLRLDHPLKKDIKDWKSKLKTPERIAGKPITPSRYGDFAEKLLRGTKKGLKMTVPFAAAAFTALDANEAWAGYQRAKTPEEKSQAIITPIARAMGYDVYEMIRDLPDATQVYEDFMGETPGRMTQTPRAQAAQKQQDAERAGREEFRADVKSGEIKNPPPITLKPPM